MAQGDHPILKTGATVTLAVLGAAVFGDDISQLLSDNTGYSVDHFTNLSGPQSLATVGEDLVDGAANTADNIAKWVPEHKTETAAIAAGGWAARVAEEQVLERNR